MMESWSLDKKNFVVTGGTKGIGYATAKSLLGHGATVLICARTATDVTNSVAALQEEVDRKSAMESSSGDTASSTTPTVVVHGVACDVSTEDGRSLLISTADTLFSGRLHGLVNNVGTNIRQPIHEQTPEEYHLMMRTNVDAVYFLCRGFFPLLSSSSQPNNTTTVVNVASAAGLRSSGTGAAYGLSKAAVIHLTKILACEWAGSNKNVRVNAVAPWMTMTPLLEEAIRNDPTQLDKVKQWTPMGRLGTLDEAVAPIVFLSMPCSGFVTGQCIAVDGGLTAQGFQGPCVI